ncbi:LacI family DNA-binding transcriptional regulator [Pedococcus sp.]|uniref:LacI family DNA-binding transcriptional regulator n=1 Tax=Pedococcus sp. TaxID=2860345 RepID=UPI002E158632|nr:LacI family DNA-binding transcriptional regulator [Pedococcus sp.]
MTLDRGGRDRATVIDVARAAGVSRQTVSNVVNQPERVAADTLERVRREIARLGFRPSRAARNLKQERAGAWGLELKTAGAGRQGNLLVNFLVSLTTLSHRHDAHIVPFTAPDPEAPIAAYEDLLASRLADGFVLTDTRHGDPRPRWLRDSGVPFASFGRIWDDPTHAGWVDIDGAAGVDAAVRHLAGNGFERIGFLGWPPGSPVGDDRRAGWSRATLDLGLQRSDWQATAAQDFTLAAAAAGPLIDRLGRGAAMVCASDALAVGAWMVLINRGWQPGLDFGLVGFDDGDLAAALDLSTVRQPLAEIADRVLALLGGEGDDVGLLIPPELVIRASSSPAGDRTQ